MQELCMARRRSGQDEGNGSGPRPFDYYTSVDPKPVQVLLAQGKLDPNLAHDMLSALRDRDIVGTNLHGIGASIYRELRPAYPDLTSYKLYKILRLLIGESKQARRQSIPSEISPEEAIPSP